MEVPPKSTIVMRFSTMTHPHDYGSPHIIEDKDLVKSERIWFLVHRSYVDIYSPAKKPLVFCVSKDDQEDYHTIYNVLYTLYVIYQVIV